MPDLQHRDGEARRVGVHQVPQPRLSRPALAAAQALRRRDGHRRARRKAGQSVHELGWVKTAGDFYRLDSAQIEQRTGFGEVSARKLTSAIEESKRQPFGRVLYALGIEEVGEVTGRNLANQFRTVDSLLEATTEQIEGTTGVGPKMAHLIHEQLADPQMRDLIADLRDEGLRFEQEGPPPGQGPLAHKTFVLTGTLPDLTREQATELIMSAGGKVTGSVSRNTAYLVAGASPGSKLAQAERLGVQVIDEQGLRELVNGRG